MGNCSSARSAAGFRAASISRVANCCSKPNFLEEDASLPDLEYLEFPIARWRQELSTHVVTVTGAEGSPAASQLRFPDAEVLAFFAQLFSFVDDALAEGRNVLVHCVDGAHSAGGAGVAFLMHRVGMDVQTAIAAARRARPIIDPPQSIRVLLGHLDAALRREGTVGAEGPRLSMPLVHCSPPASPPASPSAARLPSMPSPAVPRPTAAAIGSPGSVSKPQGLAGSRGADTEAALLERLHSPADGMDALQQRHAAEAAALKAKHEEERAAAAAQLQSDFSRRAAAEWRMHAEGTHCPRAPSALGWLPTSCFE